MLSGFTVFLDANGNGSLDKNEPRRTTGRDGGYAFGGLAAGAYLVRLQPRAGYRQTKPPRGAGSRRPSPTGR